LENGLAIKLDKVSKIYKLYDKPIDRMKEALHPFRKKYHQDFYALKKVSFSVERGEIVGVIGRNGSGKSTLLKIITKVLSPSNGNLEVNGKISALLELGAGFNPEFSGLENVYFQGSIMGYTRQEMDSRIEDILSFAGIGEFISQPVKSYSSGMFARLAFAVAINVEPSILIVDEILAVGDLSFQLKCIEKMKKMMDYGTTIIFVSHDVNIVKRFCSRAVWIDKGVIRLAGDTNIVTDRYLDFLKLDDVDFEDKDSVVCDKPKFVKKSNLIVEIQGLNILNTQGGSIDHFMNNERIIVEVIYDVYDDSIKHPVLGVAIRSVDDHYVCGLNTLLDEIEIPWTIGRNSFCLEYSYGILAVGGQYYFDVAIFEETATIAIEYVARIKNITIDSKYVGEGVYLIPHVWRNN
jgi:lipopolysaccharide transport system ATP-binding protein/teichoic acid transport system ATP-binding protein